MIDSGGDVGIESGVEIAEDELLHCKVSLGEILSSMLNLPASINFLPAIPHLESVSGATHLSPLELYLISDLGRKVGQESVLMLFIR